MLRVTNYGREKKGKKRIYLQMLNQKKRNLISKDAAFLLSRIQSLLYPPLASRVSSKSRACLYIFVARLSRAGILDYYLCT